ncbi:MAG: LysE family transporter [Sedimentisphaerales bacterium]|nr:LysE family transporter [Sedimentisphaerales bacterium]
MNFLFFLIQVLGISCSGAMQPGPVTATAIAMGARDRYAGILLAIGHGIVEFPLMVVIILGMGKYFEMPKVQTAIYLAGGIFLLLMAIQSLLSIKTTIENQSKVIKDKPIVAGIILSAGSPYFLAWWATTGLGLATQAKQWGIWAFAIFAVTHWSVDLIWLQLLTWYSNKGSVLLGPKGMRIVLMICSAALFFFGLFFIYNAVELLSH